MRETALAITLTLAALACSNDDAEKKFDTPSEDEPGDVAGVPPLPSPKESRSVLQLLRNGVVWPSADAPAGASQQPIALWMAKVSAHVDHQLKTEAAGGLTAMAQNIEGRIVELYLDSAGFAASITRAAQVLDAHAHGPAVSEELLLVEAAAAMERASRAAPALDGYFHILEGVANHVFGERHLALDRSAWPTWDCPGADSGQHEGGLPTPSEPVIETRAELNDYIAALENKEVLGIQDLKRMYVQLASMARAGSFDLAALAGRRFADLAEERGIEEHPEQLRVLANQAGLRGSEKMVIEGTTLDGTTFDQTTVEGKIILVDFFASWCHFCQQTMPKLRAFVEQHGDKGVVLLAISHDAGRDELDEYLEGLEEPMPWTVLYDGPDIAPDEPKERRHESPTAKRYGLTRNGIPFLAVIGKNGLVTHTHLGADIDETLEILANEIVDAEEPDADEAGTPKPSLELSPLAPTCTEESCPVPAEVPPAE